MKKILMIAALSIFSVLFVNSCSESSSEPTKPSKDIDELVRNAGKLDKSVVEKEEFLSSENKFNQNEDGKKWNIKLSTYSLAKNLGDGIPFNVNANSLWAGSLVQGKELPNGILNSLGDNIDRNKITISVNSGAGFLGSKEIEKPSNSTYSAALQEILKNNTSKITAKQSFSMEYAHSEKQAFIKLGISANWLGGSFSSKFTTEEKATQKSIFLIFKQSYFTVSTTEPSKPSDFFGNNIKTDDLSYYMNQDNPLCYVSSVDYGRIILVKMTYQDNISSTELIADVNQTFIGFNAGANGQYSSEFNESKATFEGIILGGSAGGAATALTSNFQGIVDLIRKDAEFSADTPAYPISYVVKNLADNSTVKLGETTEYTVKEYTESSDNYQQFDVKIGGFFVEQDCEIPSFTGEFFYSFDILGPNNQSLIGDAISVSRSQPVKADDGDFLPINKSVSFTIPNTNGSYFHLSGFIKEKNITVDDILLTINHKFNYPWNKSDIDNGWKVYSELGYFGIELTRDSECKIFLLLKITKK